MPDQTTVEPPVDYPPRQMTRRERTERAVGNCVWSSEVPDLIPEALQETTAKPPRLGPHYSLQAKKNNRDERARIAAKQQRLAEITQQYDIDQLGADVPASSPAREFLHLLYPEFRRYCEGHVDEIVMETLRKEGL